MATPALLNWGPMTFTRTRASFILMVTVFSLLACAPPERHADPDHSTTVVSPPNAGGDPAGVGGASPTHYMNDQADACGASRLQSYVGRGLTPAVRTEISSISGAVTIRWLSPNTPVTDDHSDARLNVVTQTDQTVERIYCG